MDGTLKRTFGPLALTNTLTTNVYNQGSALIYDVIKQLVVTNKTSSSHTLTLYLGATGANAAGTELYLAVVIPANTTQNFFFSPGLKMLSTDFLVGGADANTALTIMGIGVQYVV
jgi:hypothetical protein